MDHILYFPRRVVIRRALNGIVLTVKPNTVDDDFNQISINETAVLLLQEIDGKRSLSHVASAFCEKYRQDFRTTEGWISDFIGEMLDFGILSNDPPVVNHDITVINAEQVISPVSVSLEVTTA